MGSGNKMRLNQVLGELNKVLLRIFVYLIVLSGPFYI